MYDLLIYSVILFIIALTVLIWSKSKYTDAMTDPKYDESHIISSFILNRLSGVSLILLVFAVIGIILAIYDLTQSYNYG